MPKYEHFNGLKISSVSGQLFLLHRFYVENAKIDYFGEKIILSAFLIDLMCMCLQSGLTDLENTKHMNFC